MKKIYLAMAVAATLVSCNNDEIVNEAPKTPITFGNTFVENVSRAIDNTYGAQSLTQFNVYGTVTGSANNPVNIFDGDNVTGSVGSEVWTCNEIQYWISDAKYNFMAIAGVANEQGIAQGVTTDNKGMPTHISYDATTQKDVLFVKNDEYTAQTVNDPVNFTFNHILAKAIFKVTNNTDAYGNNEYNYKVKNVEILNAAKKAIYGISSTRWETPTEFYAGYPVDGSENTIVDVLDFGNVSSTSDIKNVNDTDSQEAEDITGGESAYSNYHRLLIPYNYTTTSPLTVMFTIELYKGTEIINSDTYTKDVIVNIEAGNAYSFIISVGLTNKIEFKVTSNPNWPDGEGENKTIYESIVTPSTPSEGEGEEGEGE